MDPSQVNLRKLNLVRRVIYVSVAVVVVVPYILRISLPVSPNHWVEKVYNQVDGLKPGSHVLLSFDFDPGSQAELQPMCRALLLHCFKKGLVPIVMTHWNSGLDLHKSIIEEACNEASAEGLGRSAARAAESAPASKPGGSTSVPTTGQAAPAAAWPQSGRDYVFLGYRPGDAMLVLQMGKDLKGAFEKDYYGKLTAPMPALDGVSCLKEIDLGIDLAAGATVETWIAYGSDRFGFPLAAGTTAVMAPDLYPYLQAKQLVGFLGGLRGAADYESLLRMPGEGIRGMPSQSAAHILVIALILYANGRLIADRFIRRRKG
jgi:hypothetical protein